MPLAIAAMFFTIPMIVQYNNPASFLRSAAGPLLSACSSPLDGTCLQQLEVMLRVAGRNIRQRADRNRVSIGNASARLRLRRQRTEQSDGRLADTLEFGQQVVHTTRVGLRFADVIVLLEAAQLTGIAAREAQGPVGLDALGIAQVSEHLLDTPLPRCGRRAGSLVGYAHQELPVISKLLGEEIEDWSLGNAGDVILVVLGVFGGIGTAQHSGKTVPQRNGRRQLPRNFSGGRINCI